MGLLKYLIVPLLKLFVYESKGFDKIPKQGPVILVANHSSYVDGPLVLYFVDWYCKRLPHGIIVRRIYDKNWLTRFLFGTLVRQIPTNGSVAAALERLRWDHVIMLFPEGGRTHDGKIRRATHTGLGVLAAETAAAVVPIGIEGTYAWWSRHRTLPTFKPRCIAIRVGKPLRYTGLKNKQGYRAFQSKVMKAVARLARTTYPYTT